MHTLELVHNPSPADNPRLLSPLTLAFIGDSVYELLVREKLIRQGSMPPSRLHQMAVEKVRAAAQSRAYLLLTEEETGDSDGGLCLDQRLTEEEIAVMKRGRNANTARVPKSSNPAEYRRATGVESLFGFLYLSGRIGRLNQLFEEIWQDALMDGLSHREASPDGEPL